MIEFLAAGFRYGQSPILRDVTLALAPGSFHFLTGPSGAGKTTFLKLCYRALSPQQGRIRFFGQELGPGDRDGVARLRRRIGVVHQDCQFLDHLPLIDNVMLPLSIAGENLRARADDVAALLDWVGLGERADALPPELSGGERQRAALARAVILSPEMIIADEPTGNIDGEMSERLMRLLFELNRMGKAVLIATHDLTLIRAAKAQVTARVLRIKDARVVPASADL